MFRASRGSGLSRFSVCWDILDAEPLLRVSSPPHPQQTVPRIHSLGPHVRAGAILGNMVSVGPVGAQPGHVRNGPKFHSTNPSCALPCFQRPAGLTAPPSLPRCIWSIVANPRPDGHRPSPRCHDKATQLWGLPLFSAQSRPTRERPCVRCWLSRHGLLASKMRFRFLSCVLFSAWPWDTRPAFPSITGNAGTYLWG